MIPGRTIQSRLLESIKTHRDDIAIECENNRITYHNLHRQSNYIANWLMAQGIKKESFIGIMVDDKIALVTVILGIIKAGCVFVPLDSRYPDKRTEAMLLSSETPYVFTGEDKIEKLKTIRRHLPHPLSIITMNETFYLSNRTLKLNRYDDTYKLSEAERTRYKRQILLDGWGVRGQERLKASTVFVAGAGGSGSPLIQQLALCGFGTIIICDYDTVELSNLNRQSLHDETRIGMNKALSAKKTVERINPHIKVIARQEKITSDNVFELVGDAEIIFDNVDSLEAKSHLSQCAVARGIPHMISSMIHINAYACIFHTPHTPCFHCLYDKNKIEDIKKAETLTKRYEIIPNSVASPALYLSTGFVVNEAVKILLGFGKPAYNKYIHFNQYGSPDVVLTNGYKQITYPFNRHFREISGKQGFDWDTGWHGNFIEEIVIEPDPNCPFCGKGKNSSRFLTAGKENPGPEIQGDEPLHSHYYETLPGIDYLPGDKINIYFTSGTTGQPKAVLGKNEGLTHFIAWEIKEFNIDGTKRVSQLTSQCHDPFLRDIFVPLCAGGTICVPGSIETLLDSRRMMNWMEGARVNLVHCTPSLFKIIDSDQLTRESYAHLEYILLAGEKVVPKDLETWYRVLGDRVQLVNIYGPTETTLAKLFYLINPTDLGRDTMPIGRPIPGAKIIILDKELNICGPGEVGEIYIRTPFRSYGYYNDSKLTAEKFIRNPFGSDPDDIIYKTGDLGKIDQEGNVEFVGREDRQVKIRGFRVELDEVEKRIRDYPDVREAVVINRRTGTGNHIICAYFKGEIAGPELKEYLTRELPDYMVPSFYIKMEKLPLTTNGKINYKVLPEPDEVERKEYTAPKNELEKQVVHIWTETLGIQKIGMTDGFLDMGGNSLNAMNLITRIYKEFDVNLQLSVIFENPTVEELVSIIKTSGKSLYQNITPAEKREYYPLSSSQMRMFLLKEFAGADDISYNQTKPLLLKGALDKKRLRDAFERMIARHETLRTGFETINGQPVQRIHKKVEFNIKDYIPVGAGVLAPLEVQVHIIRDFVRAFDLSHPPLLRVGLLEVSKEEHILVFDIHHIISDGVTTGIFIEEFMNLYNHKSLSLLPIHYKDYALWQQEMLGADAMKKQENYWLEVFKGDVPVLNLPTDFPRPSVQGFEGARYDFDVSPSLIRRLETLARERNATLYMVMLAAYTCLLYRYTGQEDIVVGSPTAGRPHQDLQNIPGVFINTLAMRNRPIGIITFDQLVTEVTENAFKAYENQDYPFEELVGKLDISREMSRNPLFDTMFVFQNIDMKPMAIEGLEIMPYPFDTKTSKFDISLNALETPDGFLFNIEYCTRLFRPGFVEQICRHFVTLLEAVAKNPQTMLNQIEILTERDKKQLIYDFNNTREEYDADQTIHGLFDETAESMPGKVALIHNDKNVSYQELRQRSLRLSSVLRDKGIGPDVLVGLMVERSLEMIIGMLGIMKAGGAYLPVDPGYPGERKEYMLKNSSVRLLLTGNRQKEPGYFPEGLEVIDITKKSLYSYGSKIIHSKSIGKGAGTNLVYLIYTSGSTGRPKGVMLEHKNLVNLMRYCFKYTNMDFSRILQFHTMGFDVSIQEIAGALLSGGELYLINEEMVTDIPALFEVIRKNGIKTLFLPMSFLKMIFTEEHYVDIFPGCVKHIQTAGEQVVINYRLRCFLQENHVYLHNHYGPSETHVVTALTLEPHGEIPELPPIGKPVLNTGIYILDKERHLQPVDVPGELYIGGLQVGRGYMNRPELTAEKLDRDFQDDQDDQDEKGPASRGTSITVSKVYNTTHPLTHSPIYRTGDLARWLSDGNIEFLGRIDNQVKIRGFRVEPGEVESQLLVNENIKEAVVIDGKDNKGDKSLFAYFVSGEKIDVSALRDRLSESLPDYMIPSFFIQIEKMPLTASGKIDRKALPSPGIKIEAEVIPPGNDRQRKLAAIWSEVLGIEKDKIGIDSDFFELGGHSLKAILTGSKIHRNFNVKINLVDMFENSTLKALAEFIEGAEEEDYSPIEPAEKKEYYELSFHQKRLWLIRQLEGENISFHMPMRIELLHPVKETALKHSLQRLTNRHESLRTAVREVNGIPVQFIEPGVEIPLKTMDISNVSGSEKQREREQLFQEAAVTPFDFTAAPLFRACLIKWDTSGYDLVVTMHHIITDGWSMEILKRDFNRFYESTRMGKDPEPVSPLPLQYKDFCQWYYRQLDKTEQEKASHQFWADKLADGIPILRLPVDSRENREDTRGAAYRCSIDKDLKKRLKKLAAENNTTLSMVMFTIYNILLSHVSGQEDIVCSLISAGRDHLSLGRIVGYFTTSIMVITHVDAEEDFNALLHRVHTDVMETVQHQEYPLESVLDELKMNYPDIAVSFNMFDLPEGSAAEETETFEPYHMDKVQGVKFDLALFLTEYKDSIELLWNYKKTLFNPHTIESFVRIYFDLLSELSGNEN